MATGKALCGNAVGTNTANQIQFYNQSNSKLLTIHNYGIRIWTADLINKKIQFQDVNMGQIKRVYQCCVIDPTDSTAYLGTKTGDLVEISLERALFKRFGPIKRLFSQGVNSVNLLANGDLLIGAGDGTIAKISSKDM